MTTARAALYDPVNERDFQNQVIELATLCGWRVQAFRAARTKDGWRTPLQGHRGGPDLLLVRERVLFRELKRDSGRLTEEQEAWGAALQAAGADWAVWRPREWPRIEDALRGAVP